MSADTQRPRPDAVVPSSLTLVRAGNGGWAVYENNPSREMMPKMLACYSNTAHLLMGLRLTLNQEGATHPQESDGSPPKGFREWTDPVPEGFYSPGERGRKPTP